MSCIRSAAWGSIQRNGRANDSIKKDIVDLQCWSNLVWMHPLCFEQDADLAEFRNKGRGWTEKEKQWLLDKQMELLRQVVPLHRELMERGQVELTHHALLPSDYAVVVRQAFGTAGNAQRHAAKTPRGLCRRRPRTHSPGGRIPTRNFSARSRAACGLRKAPFARASSPTIAEAGIQWVGTDEEILSCSTDGWVSRDGNGYLRNPEMLYRPWRVDEQGKTLQLVFRDHAMSDQIGFHYHRYSPEHAVNDFIGKLEAIGNATGGKRRTSAHLGPASFSTAKTAGNTIPTPAWIFCAGYINAYHNTRRSRACASATTWPDTPATDKIGHLFPGSWIQHNFGIWIGHPECNKAWDAVFENAAVAAGHRGAKIKTGR